MTSEYWETTYLPEKRIYAVSWKPTANDMGAQEFKRHIEHLAEFAEKNPVEAMLGDSSLGHYTIPTDIQEWHDSAIAPRYLAAGVRRIAFVLPEDLFAAASLEQAFEEANASALEVRFFGDREQALRFLAQG